MKQFAIIGLSRFGRRVLEELLDTNTEILIIDKDREVIDFYKDKVTTAYIADAINEEIIRRLVPPNIDAAIVDLGDRLEVSILVTNYLKKIGVKEIIAKAETDDHGEILELVGATRIVLPNKEAAKRIVPLLISSLVFSYLPISADFVIAEIKVPPTLVGKSLIQVDFRRKHRINVIAFRKIDVENYALFSPEYRLKEDDILLVGGSEQDIGAFGEVDSLKGTPRLTAIFKRLFSRKEQRGE